MSGEHNLGGEGPPRPASGKARESRTPTWELFLRFMVVLFAALLVAGLAAEWRFWALWLAGARASATVTRKEEKVVAHVPARSSGRLLPLIETGLHFQFTDSAGQARKGCVWLRQGAEDWAVGDRLKVMYAGSGWTESVPASLSFYWSHDTAWRLMLILAVGSGVGFLSCLISAVLARRRRLRRWHFLQAATLSQQASE